MMSTNTSIMIVGLVKDDTKLIEIDKLGRLTPNLKRII